MASHISQDAALFCRRTERLQQLGRWCSGSLLLRSREWKRLAVPRAACAARVSMTASVVPEASASSDAAARATSTLRRAIKTNLFRTASRRPSWTPSDWSFKSRRLAQQSALPKSVAKVRSGYDRLVIHPSSRWKYVFDIIIFVSIIYTIIVAPLSVCFELDHISVFFDEFMTISEVLFAIDIVLQFFHGFYELGSPRLPVLALRTVWRQYGQLVNVVPDILSVLPLYAIDPMFREWQLIRLVRLARLRRLRRRWRGLSSSGSVLKM